MKYFFTSDFNKFTNNTLHAKIKERANISDIYRFINNSDLEEKTKIAAKVELKAEKIKIVKLQTHDLSYIISW